MNILVAADVLNELYNNGVIRSSSKLDERDFLQMGRAALGSVIRATYYDEKQKSESVYHFVASCVRPIEIDVKIDKRGRILPDIDYDQTKIVKLPDGNGILRVTPIPNDEKGKIDYAKSFTKGIAGSEHLYCTTAFLEDTGEQIYISVANQVQLHTATPPKKVELLAVIFNDDTEIPDDIVWQMFTYIFTFILKIQGVSVDTTDDSNPVVQAVKSKMATAQPL